MLFILNTKIIKRQKLLKVDFLKQRKKHIKWPLLTPNKATGKH